MFVIIQQSAGQPARARICEKVELTTYNGGWLYCFGFPYEPGTDSVSLNINTVNAVYEVQEV